MPPPFPSRPFLLGGLRKGGPLLPRRPHSLPSDPSPALPWRPPPPKAAFLPQLVIPSRPPLSSLSHSLSLINASLSLPHKCKASPLSSLSHSLSLINASLSLPHKCKASPPLLRHFPSSLHFFTRRHLRLGPRLPPRPPRPRSMAPSPPRPSRQAPSSSQVEDDDLRLQLHTTASILPTTFYLSSSPRTSVVFGSQLPGHDRSRLRLLPGLRPVSVFLDGLGLSLLPPASALSAFILVGLDTRVAYLPPVTHVLDKTTHQPLTAHIHGKSLIHQRGGTSRPALTFHPQKSSFIMRPQPLEPQKSWLIMTVQASQARFTDST